MIVFIDSNIIRGDPRVSSSGMQAISYYSKIGLLEVYIPEVVKDEVVSSNQDITDGAIDKISDTLSALRKAGLSDTGFKIVEEINVLVKNNRLELNISINERFLRWIDDNKIIVYPLKESIYDETMQAYFSGSAPFNKRREREHIPDALIYFSLKRFLRTNREVYFLSRDENLAKYASDIGCVCFSKAEDLINSDRFKAHLIINIPNYSSEVVSIFSENIKKYPRAISSKILYKLSDDFVSVAEISLPGVSGSNPQINELRHTAVTHISPNSLSLTANNELSIDFFASVEVAVSYVIHQSIFEVYDFGEREIVTEVQGDNVVIQEVISLKVEGRTSIIIEQKDWISVLYHERAVQRIIETFSISDISCLAYPAIEKEHFIDFEWLDVSNDYDYDHNYYQDEDIYDPDVSIIDKMEAIYNSPEDDDLPF